MRNKGLIWTYIAWISIWLLPIVVLTGWVVTGKRDSIVRFDGIYQNPIPDTSDGLTSYHYLRFYEDKTVLSTSSLENTRKVKKWFNKDNQNISRGKYKIRGNKIRFNTYTNSKPKVKVVFQGEIITRNTLKLHSKSFYNWLDPNSKYKFVQNKSPFKQL